MRRVLVSLLLIALGVPSIAADEIKLDDVKPQKIEIPKSDVKLKDSIVINEGCHGRNCQTPERKGS